MSGQGPLKLDTSKPHPARTYDWFLGGKDNYPVDEELGRKMLALDPIVPAHAAALLRGTPEGAVSHATADFT